MSTIKIDLYIHRKKKGTWVSERRVPSLYHTYQYSFPPELMTSTTRHLSQDEERTLKIVEDFARRKNVHVSVHDLRHLKERIKARLVGVRRMPTTVIGSRKIEGVPAIDELEAALALLDNT